MAMPGRRSCRSPRSSAGASGLPYDLADDWLDYARLELTVYTDNAAALVLDRKFGFEIEGTLKSYAFRGGRFIDAYTMARLAPAPVGPARKAAGGTARRKRPS